MSEEKAYLVNYTCSNIFRVDGVRFVPGLNKLSRGQWDSIKNHPLLPKRFEKGHLEWVKGRSPDDYNESPVEEVEADASGELSAFKAPEAIELIESTYDLELLKSWQESEARKGVSSAIEKQIDALITVKDES